MNKRLLTQTATALLIAITSLAYGNAAAAGTATMKMTTAIKGEVTFWLSGTGEVVIDWGDGSAPETATIHEYFIVPRLTHTFSGTTSRTIAIDGQNIIALNCTDMRLTALDVSNNTALTDLSCSNNLLTAEGLNALFGTLHSNAGTKSISIRNNPGTATCDRTIATGKFQPVAFLLGACRCHQFDAVALKTPFCNKIFDVLIL